MCRPRGQPRNFPQDSLRFEAGGLDASVKFSSLDVLQPIWGAEVDNDRKVTISKCLMGSSFALLEFQRNLVGLFPSLEAW